MLDLLVEGKLPAAGFRRQEEVPLPVFLANRFGRVYAGEPVALPAVTTGGLDAAA
jgi:hypothetical protein